MVKFVLALLPLVMLFFAGLYTNHVLAIMAVLVMIATAAYFRKHKQIG